MDNVSVIVLHCSFCVCDIAIDLLEYFSEAAAGQQ